MSKAKFSSHLVYDVVQSNILKERGDVHTRIMAQQYDDYKRYKENANTININKEDPDMDKIKERKLKLDKYYKNNILTPILVPKFEEPDKYAKRSTLYIWEHSRVKDPAKLPPLSPPIYHHDPMNIGGYYQALSPRSSSYSQSIIQSPIQKLPFSDRSPPCLSPIGTVSPRKVTQIDGKHTFRYDVFDINESSQYRTIEPHPNHTEIELPKRSEFDLLKKNRANYTYNIYRQPSIERIHNINHQTKSSKSFRSRNNDDAMSSCSTKYGDLTKRVDLWRNKVIREDKVNVNNKHKKPFYE